MGWLFTTVLEIHSAFAVEMLFCPSPKLGQCWLLSGPVPLMLALGTPHGCGPAQKLLLLQQWEPLRRVSIRKGIKIDPKWPGGVLLRKEDLNPYEALS